MSGSSNAADNRVNTEPGADLHASQLFLNATNSVDLPRGKVPLTVPTWCENETKLLKKALHSKRNMLYFGNSGLCPVRQS